MNKLETAVKGKNGKNLSDLVHLDQFVHTSRCNWSSLCFFISFKSGEL